MAIISMVNGKLTVNNRPAKWCQWTLLVGDMDGSSSGRGEGISLPGAMGGLPGGTNVASEAELFKKFAIPVQGETHLQAPGGATSTLNVQFRAKRADDMTGPGIRIKEVDESNGEVNEVRKANQLAQDLLEAFAKDAASGVSDAQKKEQRERLAAALRTLADVL